jgi:hypothetical protein
MTTVDFITELFCRVDDVLREEPVHAQAPLHPSELVTVALLFALKGVGNRAFYRWLSRDYRPLFPRLPERTRLFRLFVAHQAWTDYFLADPSVLGIADTYGIELRHPRRAGRSTQQIGRKGLSNHRWIVGGKLGVVLNQVGLVSGWALSTANTHDTHFRPMVAQFAEEMIGLTDHGFHGKTGDPPNMKVCRRGEWNERMLVETMLSMVTTVCHFKKLSQRKWQYFEARLAYTLAVFNVLLRWDSEQTPETRQVRFSIAEFAL